MEVLHFKLLALVLTLALGLVGLLMLPLHSRSVNYYKIPQSGNFKSTSEIY